MAGHRGVAAPQQGRLRGRRHAWMPRRDAHVDPFAAQRGAFGTQPAQRLRLVAGHYPAVGGHHPVPGHRVSVPRHDRANLARPAVPQPLGDHSILHHPAGRNLLDQREHILHEVTAALRTLLCRHRTAAGAARWCCGAAGAALRCAGTAVAAL